MGWTLECHFCHRELIDNLSRDAYYYAEDKGKMWLCCKACWRVHRKWWEIAEDEKEFSDEFAAAE